MKKRPYCAEEIQDEAIKCRWCGTMLTAEVPTSAAAAGPVGESLQYTHSGRRYLLGYGRDFFGIWDRQRPGSPISTFPRTDDGWRQAWLRFAAEEPYSTEVAIGAPAASAGSAAAPTAWGSQAGVGLSAPRRHVSGAWWLLPIFMGWLGGLIAWLVNRDADPQKARAMLIAGIVISVLALLVIIPAMNSAVP